MKVPAFMRGAPRMAYVVAVPVVIFAVTVAISLATSAGNDNKNDTPAVVIPQETPSLANVDSAPTRTPTPVPTATPEPTAVPPPNRENCDQIRGTDYLSPEEREWYLANCTGGRGGGGGGAVAGGSAPYLGEYSLGDRLIIPSIGLNVSVNGVTVPSSGVMPDPIGFYNAVWYDFSNFGGLGGYVEGNHVLAGHVTHQAAPAAFYSVRNLAPGATIQYVTSGGQTLTYTVVYSASFPASTNFTGFVASGAADLTLITCTGAYGGGEYSDRHVIQAVRS